MAEPGLFRFAPPRSCWFRFQGEVDADQVQRLLDQVANSIRDEPYFYLTIDMSEFIKDSIAARRRGADIMNILPPRAVAVVAADWGKRVVAKLVFKGSELLAGKHRRQFSEFFPTQEEADAWLESMTPTLEQAAERLGTLRKG
jgi:hypothetical protein